MKSSSRLVKDIDGIARIFFRELFGKFYSFALFLQFTLKSSSARGAMWSRNIICRLVAISISPPILLLTTLNYFSSSFYHDQLSHSLIFLSIRPSSMADTFNLILLLLVFGEFSHSVSFYICLLFFSLSVPIFVYLTFPICLSISLTLPH